MGNAIDRQKLAEEYPTVYGNISCEQYDDDFVFVSVSPPPNVPPEAPAEGERGDTASLVNSLDSGYEDINLQDVEMIPDGARTQNTEDGEAEAAVACKTDAGLGQHSSHLGFRLYEYCDDSEGNMYITDADL